MKFYIKGDCEPSIHHTQTYIYIYYCYLDQSFQAQTIYCSLLLVADASILFWFGIIAALIRERLMAILYFPVLLLLKKR